MPDSTIPGLPAGTAARNQKTVVDDGTGTYWVTVDAILNLFNDASALTVGTLPDARLSANVVLTNNAALSNARSPTAHKGTHSTGGSDALSPADIGAAAVTHAATHATGGTDVLTPGAIGAATANHQHAYADITGKPASFAPSTHASTHQAGGADAVPSVPTTTNLAADTNALSVAAFDIVRLTSSAARNVNGLDATGCADGKLVLLVNENAAGGAAITIKHAAGAAAAGNRVKSQFGSDIVLQADGGQVLVHLSSVAGCWRA